MTSTKPHVTLRVALQCQATIEGCSSYIPSVGTIEATINPLLIQIYARTNP